MIKVLIADDHPIVRRGIRQALSETDDIAVTDEAGDCMRAMQKIQQKRFDVVLLDIAMPGRGGVELLKQLRGSGIRVPVLILSIFPEEQYAIRALRAGASGYISKSCEAETLIQAIRKVAGGGKFVSEAVAERLVSEIAGVDKRPPHELLSDREFEVFRQIASGKSLSEIAEEMALSLKTVSTYRSRILHKMRAKNNAELTRYAIQNNLLN
jgi:two-component system invasion response regulator UvrY